MYSELVKRLREIHPGEFGNKWDFAFACQQTMHEAADAIGELQQTAEHYKGSAEDWYNEALDYKATIPCWIPVTERLPENWTSVIVHRKDGGIFIWEYFDTSQTDECWIDDSGNIFSFYDVTHWIPLPMPPKEVDV